MSLRSSVSHVAIKLLLCVLVMCGSAAMAVWNWQFGKETLTWLPVPGEVTLRTTRHHTRSSPHLLDPEIHIEYKVDAQAYELVVEDSYVLQTPLIVYYDPRQPEHAVVEPGVDRGWMFASALVGGLAALAFVVLIVLTLRPDLQSADSQYED